MDVDVLIQYGSVTAQLTNTQRDLLDLQAKYNALMSERNALQIENHRQKLQIESMQQYEAQLVRWAESLRNAVLDFCAQNNALLNLPPQPMAITFNAPITNNGGTLTGNIISDNNGKG